MSSFERIVVATDYSPAARHAADLACGLAARTGAKVTLLHVWDIPLPAYAENVIVPVDELRSAAREALDAEAKRLGRRIPEIRTLLLTGNPWRAIVEAVTEHGFDLVVVGTQGRRGVARALLGSVAEKVVRTAPVPVLSVHAPGGQDG